MSQRVNYSALFKLVFTVFCIIVVGIIFSKIFIGATLVVDASQAESIHFMNVLVNDKVVSGRNEAKKTFQLSHQVGKKKIIVRRAGYKDFETSTTAYFRTTTTIKPDFIEEPAGELAKKLDSKRPNPGSSIGAAKYFNDHEWLAYRVTNGNSIDSLIVRYDSLKADWIFQNNGEGGEMFIDEQHPLPEALYKEFLR